MRIVRTERSELTCELTEQEIDERGRRACALHGEIEALEAHRKAVASELAGRLKRLRDDHTKLTTAVTTGKEVRPVDCEVLADLYQRAFITVRLDTGEEHARRAMSPQEYKTEEEKQRQADLPLDEEQERPRPPESLLKKGASPEDQQRWLRDNGFPWCTGLGFARRNMALLIAIDQDDYDEGAAEATFGPIEWPGAEEGAP